MYVTQGTPAHLLAMAALPPPALRLTLSALLYRYLATQVALSAAWALFEHEADQAPFAVVGLACGDAGVVEAFMIVRPGGLPGHLMLGLVRFAKRQFDALGGPCVSWVVPGNRPGERLARMCGFEPCDVRFGMAQQWRRL